LDHLEALLKFSVKFFFYLFYAVDEGQELTGRCSEAFELMILKLNSHETYETIRKMFFVNRRLTFPPVPYRKNAAVKNVPEKTCFIVRSDSNALCGSSFLQINLTIYQTTKTTEK
jgi:hypothetical protein